MVETRGGGAELTAREPLTDAEPNGLFCASWPGHRDTSFAPVLAEFHARCGFRPTAAGLLAL
ncbi:hypothetical protein ACFVX6_38400 [Streptomyces sp. NPDC058289]|uniref:hypothetical protein n=1 Tax=Streptomyces sp. NPDC058289 TaxID=3346425 RepID=UPI0036E46A31